MVLRNADNSITCSHLGASGNEWVLMGGSTQCGLSAAVFKGELALFVRCDDGAVA